MFIYNVLTPSKRFSLADQDGETFDQLVQRVGLKGGVASSDLGAIKTRRDGAGLEYEFDGGRWSLEDDGDLAIFQSRFPAATSQSATLHLTPPHARAHFAPETKPTASSALKSKVQSKSQASGNTSNSASPALAPPVSAPTSQPSQGSQGPPPPNSRAKIVAQFVRTSHGDFVPRFNPGQGKPITTLTESPAPPPPSVRPNKPKANGSAAPATHTLGPSGGKLLPEVDATGDILPRPHNIASKESDFSKFEKTIGHTADGFSIARPKSAMSKSSRRSKYGEEDPEPWWDIHKRRWLDFHANNGVRTVVGKVAGVDNVRMLLKPGYHQVYVSRSFAMKNGLVHDKYAMGAAGYTGIKILGPISITVGSRTATHQALVNEEQHFDVVLGRKWIEKMAVKVDPLDLTMVTYMDSGEAIPCDLVVLKDGSGNVITVT